MVIESIEADERTLELVKTWRNIMEHIQVLEQRADELESEVGRLSGGLELTHNGKTIGRTELIDYVGTTYVLYYRGDE